MYCTVAEKFAQLKGGKEKDSKEPKEKKGGKAAGGGDKKKEKAAAEESKKETKEEPPEEMDETEAILAAESKGTDPFAQFPKGYLIKFLGFLPYCS